MICPRCETETVINQESGVEIDFCESCRGMFLDKGELNKIAEKIEGDLEYCTVAQDSLKHEDSHQMIKCPKCQDSEMSKVDFNIYTDIILDYCGKCGGFWLDGEEYDRINNEVKRLNEVSKNQPDPKMIWLAKFLWRLPF